MRNRIVRNTCLVVVGTIVGLSLLLFGVVIVGLSVPFAHQVLQGKQECHHPRSNIATHLFEHDPWERLDTGLPDSVSITTQAKYGSAEPSCTSLTAVWDGRGHDLTFLAVDRFNTSDEAQTALSEQNYDGPKYYLEEVGTHLESATRTDSGGYADAVYVRDCLLLVARWSYSFPDESTPEDRDAQILPFLEPLAAEVCSAPDA